jgi:hypothetical protein
MVTQAEKDYVGCWTDLCRAHSLRLSSACGFWICTAQRKHLEPDASQHSPTSHISSESHTVEPQRCCTCKRTRVRVATVWRALHMLGLRHLMPSWCRSAAMAEADISAAAAPHHARRLARPLPRCLSHSIRGPRSSGAAHLATAPSVCTVSAGRSNPCRRSSCSPLLHKAPLPRRSRRTSRDSRNGYGSSWCTLAPSRPSFTSASERSDVSERSHAAGPLSPPLRTWQARPESWLKLRCVPRHRASYRQRNMATLGPCPRQTRGTRPQSYTRWRNLGRRQTLRARTRVSLAPKLCRCSDR